MTEFEQAIKPVYNLIYLAAALVVANLIGFIIYRRNVKRHGRRAAYGSGWAVSIPMSVVVVMIWTLFF